MSIIAFYKNTLLADTKGIVNKGHVVNFDNAPKIFRSECNRFAYGKVGVKMAGIKHDLFIKEIESALISFYAEGRDHAFDNEFCKKHSYYIENMIVMSKDRIWCSVEDANLFDYPIGDYLSLGSGSSMFRAAVVLGKTGRQALEFTINNCFSCGGEVEEITQKSLKPFKILK